MAKVQLTGAVSDIRGKLAGSSFQNTQYGLQLNRINKPVNPLVNSSSQYRQFWRFATKKWRELSNSERNTWLAVYPNNEEAFKAFVTRYVETDPLFGIVNFNYVAPLVSGWQFANVLNSPFGSNLRLSVIGSFIIPFSHELSFSIIPPTTEELSIKADKLRFFPQTVIYSGGTVLTEVVFDSLPPIPVGQQRYIQIAARLCKFPERSIENIQVSQWLIG
jgi:hypothetical protein